MTEPRRFFQTLNSPNRSKEDRSRVIYEWRVYEIMPGKKKPLGERFAKHSLRLFKKHGMEVLGFWESSVGGRSNTYYYMLAFKSLGHLEEAWRSFSSDPEWQEVVASSEKDGPLVSSISNIVLRPTSFSPLQ
jgi:NIPSNAP